MNNLFNIYLAGPIRYQTNEKFNEYDFSWREEIKKLLQDHFNCFNPLDYQINLQKEYFDIKIKKELYQTDMELLNESDALVANLIPFTEDNYPCLGTLFEIGYISNVCHPVIITTDPVIINNPMYYNCIFVKDIEDATKKLIKMYYNY